MVEAEFYAPGTPLVSGLSERERNRAQFIRYEIGMRRMGEWTPLPALRVDWQRIKDQIDAAPE